MYVCTWWVTLRNVTRNVVTYMHPTQGCRNRLYMHHTVWHIQICQTQIDVVDHVWRCFWRYGDGGRGWQCMWGCYIFLQCVLQWKGRSLVYFEHQCIFLCGQLTLEQGTAKEHSCCIVPSRWKLYINHSTICLFLATYILYMCKYSTFAWLHMIEIFTIHAENLTLNKALMY